MAQIGSTWVCEGGKGTEQEKKRRRRRTALASQQILVYRALCHWLESAVAWWVCNCSPSSSERRNNNHTNCKHVWCLTRTKLRKYGVHSMSLPCFQPPTPIQVCYLQCKAETMAFFIREQDVPSVSVMYHM